MASSLLTLLDDIVAVLDDVAVLSKIAAKKTAGVLGDDLALNAEQVSGVRADRELPVVWAVAKGSALNKCILVPVALLISAFAPILITPLLMIGGAFLCFEGVEKVWHSWAHRHGPHDDPAEAQAAQEALHAPDYERNKIRGAIRTDFILSAEIIAITLGTVAGSPLMTQILVLSGIAIAMTIGVYGLVALIVKLDDAGLYLSQRGGAKAAVGRALLAFAPYLMKGLSIAGTAAMFLVGGGIIVHGIAALTHWAHALESVSFLAPMLFNAIVGAIVGSIVVLGVTAIQKLRA